MFFERQFKKNFIFLSLKGYLFYDLRIYVQNVCFISFTIILFIMKNLLESFKSREFKGNGFELLTENEMQVIRGGAEPIKPTSRPREVFDYEETAS